MKKDGKKQKIILLVCNLFLIVITLAGAGIYSRYIRNMQEKTRTEDFIRTIESMKQVSQNYLDNEKGYVKDWASYISGQNMTVEEALDFLRSINTNQERFIHIVDMESYEAYSSYYPKGMEKIDTYLQYKEGASEYDILFGNIMQSMFYGTEEEFSVLGKYRLQETQAMAVGVGSRVTLREGDEKKDYLLLRIVPVDVIKKSWVFPMEYSSAEVGIVTNSGDYVIQSTSMKSQNFIEYIRGYNFQNDYNGVEKLQSQLKDTNRGTFWYKNYKGTDCLWYYSSFGTGSALDILGVMDTAELRSSADAWYIIAIVCGILIILVLVDGAYLLSINRKLREAARVAEQASMAKTQFLSAMSHDIRTPLNAVMGMMRIAQKKASDADRVVECMDKGMQSGKQLLTLINDVLDISKIESGKVTLNRERVSLEMIIDDLLELLSENVEKKKIKLECDFNELPYRYVCADGMRLTQIYTNLLTNAVKYTDSGGTIRLRLREETIPGKTDEIRLVFYVEDTGIGMTEEFQKNMYTAFTREIKTQVNRTQGTGLGLSIVKQMVDLMGGTIDCNSVPGKGTSFTVVLELPIVEENEKTNSVQEQSEDFAPMHLLVAEDNALNWEITRELLTELGMTCDRAENGEACLEMLLKSAPDTYRAILMDVQMPVMNGFETTKKIRSLNDERKKKIPVIAMTADAYAEDVQACIKSGMNGHIAKPVDVKKLKFYLRKIQKEQW